MRSFIAAFALLMSTHFAAAADGWTVKDSVHSVAETADKLVAAVENAGATLFARVDHAKGAEMTGQTIPPATLVIFGNPKIGTPIIAANPKAGLDLPIRVLIWDDNGQTKIGYLAPETLKSRYNIEGADESLKTMGGAAGKLTDAASK